MDVDLEAVLTRIQADRAQAEAQLRAAQDHLNDLISKEAGVQVTINAIKEYGEPPQTTPQAEQAPAQEPRWAALNNMEAAVAALAEIGHPASTREIYEKLRAAGRHEGFEQVRAALGYLKRKGKIGTASRGLWQPPDAIESTAEAPAAVAGPHLAAPEITPTGSNAAGRILQSDTTRFWTARDVLAEEIRRGWAEPTKKHDATRIALVRLRKQFPQIERVDTPVMAYRWRAESSPSHNGSRTSHEEASG